jgi:hypothetical protein
MTKWLTDAGIKVTESKMEMCVLHRMDTTPISFTGNKVEIIFFTSMNVLGVPFNGHC